MVESKVAGGSDRKVQNTQRDKLTALFNPLNSSIPNLLIHRLNSLLNRRPRILARIQARRKADALGGCSQGGAGSFDGDGSEERHIFCRVLEME